MKKLLLFVVFFCATPSAFALTLAEPEVLAPMSEVRQTVDKGNFHLDIVQPSFGIPGIDTAIGSYIQKTKNAYLKNAKDLFNEDEVDYTPHASLDISYSVINDKDDVVSVRFDEYTYLGGAHGTPVNTTFTFDKKTGKEITLTKKKSLEKVAKLIRPKLYKTLTDEEMSDDTWMVEGTEPVANNYSAFTLETDGNGKAQSITVYFQAYQVAAYAAGMPGVKISKDGTIEVIR